MNTMNRTFKPYGIIHTKRSLEYICDYKLVQPDYRKDDKDLCLDTEPKSIVDRDTLNMDYAKAEDSVLYDKIQREHNENKKWLKHKNKLIEEDQRRIMGQVAQVLE